MATMPPLCWNSCSPSCPYTSPAARPLLPTTHTCEKEMIAIWRTLPCFNSKLAAFGCLASGCAAQGRLDRGDLRMLPPLHSSRGVDDGRRRAGPSLTPGEGRAGGGGAPVASDSLLHKGARRLGGAQRGAQVAHQQPGRPRPRPRRRRALRRKCRNVAQRVERPRLVAADAELPLGGRWRRQAARWRHGRLRGAGGCGVGGGFRGGGRCQRWQLHLIPTLLQQLRPRVPP